MKINQSKLRNWDFRDRLEEIEDRLDLLERLPMDPGVAELIDEMSQIVNYWLKHMKRKSR